MKQGVWCGRLALQHREGIIMTSIARARRDFLHPMRITFCIAAALVLGYTAHASGYTEVQWVRGFYTQVENDVQGFGTAIDSDGNAYLAGSFHSEGAPAGGRLSVAKVDADGEVVWVRHLPSNGVVSVGAMGMDAEDNVYLTGYFAGDLFDTPDDEHPLMTVTGTIAAFLLKLDPDGSVLDAWAVAHSRSADGLSAGTGVTVDSSGNILISGVFTGEIDFDPDQGGAIMEGDGGFNGFLAKWSPSGQFQWARKISGEGQQELHGVAVDAEDNVYATGWTGSPAAFGPEPGSTPLETLGAHDVLVIKVDPAGSLEWHQTVGNGAEGKGMAVTVAPSGSIIVGGELWGLPLESESESETDSLGHGGFVASLNADGGIQWARGFDGIGNPFLALAVDAAGRIYLAGAFAGTLDFRTGEPSDTFESQGHRDAFVAQYSANGQFRWARVAQGDGPIRGHGIAVSGEQDIVYTGFFGGTTDFDPGSGEHIITSGGTVGTSGGAFIARLTTPKHNPYDITGTGVVDAVDVQIVINAALGIEVEYNADVTGSGKVDAVDVQLVINAALGILAP